jgi:hypothetical protein
MRFFVDRGNRRSASIVGTSMRTVVVVGVLVMAAVGMAVPAEPALACTCASGGDEHAFQQADAVFVGTVVSAPTTPSAGPWSSADPAEWVFEVESVYKGSVSERQSVWTPLSGASCGLELPTENVAVVVFADPAGGELLTGAPPVDDALFASLCGGSRALGSTPVPASFGEPQAPRSGDSGEPPGDDQTDPGAPATEAAGAVALGDERDPWILWGGMALGLVVAGTVAALLLRGRTRP